ncbi:restriction endonuclease subunit S [Helicobacter pylori]|uniref:restriction endonuclease subunit S n=1 Tax=Helicobacter pylori TaxID=210 RepID=UPI00042EF9FB|nr:restriction endonuclease subunit S [Helicobacter pylori]AHN45563.1 type I restriction endonuclease subunit S [Helicobacter pylori oki898]
MDALMLPLNWQRVRLGDIAEIIGGDTPSTQITSFWNGSINWFTPTEIGITKYVYKSQRTITPLGLKKSSAKLLPIGTILLTSRASIGDCAILKVVATTNQGFQSLIPLEKINNEFLYYLMLTLKNKLLKLASGSTFLEVSPNKIKNLLIPLPPLNEQSAIANILSDLDRYLCTLDALILKKEGVKKSLSFELLSQRKRLKDFNQAWQKVRLGDIANYLTSNLSVEQITQQGEIKVYDVNNFIGYTDTTFISDKPYISIVKDGSVGRVRILPPKTNILSTMGALIANHRTTTEFLFYLLSNFDFKNFTSGSIIPHIYFKDYKEKTIFLPPLNEQSAIANILSALDNEIASLKNKKRQFENIKKALNHDLMSAKIRVLEK